MQLQAKAKPVKIRIQSGGEEHFSLDQLKSNFCIDDIKPLLDNRLSRWLKQQRKEDLAQKIDEFDKESLDNSTGWFNFIEIFFEDEIRVNGLSSLIDLAKHWTETHPYKKNGLRLYEYLLHKDLEAAKYLYYNNYFEEKNWFEIFSSFEDSLQDAEIMYILGDFYYNGKHVVMNKSKGVEFFRNSTKKGYKPAIEKIGQITEELQEKEQREKEQREKEQRTSKQQERYREIKEVELYEALEKQIILARDATKSRFNGLKESKIRSYILAWQHMPFSSYDLSSIKSYSERGLLVFLIRAGEIYNVVDSDLPMALRIAEGLLTDRMIPFSHEIAFIFALIHIKKGENKVAHNIFKLLIDNGYESFRINKSNPLFFSLTPSFNKLDLGEQLKTVIGTLIR